MFHSMTGMYRVVGRIAVQLLLHLAILHGPALSLSISGIHRWNFTSCENLDDTSRGAGGFRLSRDSICLNGGGINGLHFFRGGGELIVRVTDLEFQPGWVAVGVRISPSRRSGRQVILSCLAKESGFQVGIDEGRFFFRVISVDGSKKEVLTRDLPEALFRRPRRDLDMIGVYTGDHLEVYLDTILSGRLGTERTQIQLPEDQITIGSSRGEFPYFGRVSDVWISTVKTSLDGLFRIFPAAVVPEEENVEDWDWGYPVDPSYYSPEDTSRDLLKEDD